MARYTVIKVVEVEYFYNVEAKNEKEAKEIAENRTFEDNYQWGDIIEVRVEKEGVHN